VYVCVVLLCVSGVCVVCVCVGGGVCAVCVCVCVYGVSVCACVCSVCVCGVCVVCVCVRVLLDPFKHFFISHTIGLTEIPYSFPARRLKNFRVLLIFFPQCARLEHHTNLYPKSSIFC